MVGFAPMKGNASTQTDCNNKLLSWIFMSKTIGFNGARFQIWNKYQFSANVLPRDNPKWKEKKENTE